MSWLIWILERNLISYNYNYWLLVELKITVWNSVNPFNFLCREAVKLLCPKCQKSKCRHYRWFSPFYIVIVMPTGVGGEVDWRSRGYWTNEGRPGLVNWYWWAENLTKTMTSTLQAPEPNYQSEILTIHQWNWSYQWTFSLCC